jgi:hypothetical protein
MKANFDALIEAGNKKLLFNFMQVYYGSQLYYNVTIMLNNRPLLFRMKKIDDDNWKIAPQSIPNWIYESEMKLASAIKES